MKTSSQSSKYFLIKKASSNMFVAIIIASVLVSFSVVSIKFLLDLRSFNSSVQSEQSKVIDTLNTNITNYEQLKEDYGAFEEGSDILSDQGDRTNSTTVFDALPSKYDYPAIVTAIENVARLSGVELTGVAGDDNIEGATLSDPNPQPIEISFSLSLNGSYQSIQRFFTRLEQTIRPYSVRSVQLSGSDSSLRANVSITTYYQPSIDLSEEVKRSITE